MRTIILFSLNSHSRPFFSPGSWLRCGSTQAACTDLPLAHHRQTSLNHQLPAHTSASWREKHMPCRERERARGSTHTEMSNFSCMHYSSSSHFFVFPFSLLKSLLIDVSYLNSFSLLPRRSRTSHWQEKASWEGIPHLITAFRKAFLWRVLKPNTCNTHTHTHTCTLNTICKTNGSAASQCVFIHYLN